MRSMMIISALVLLAACAEDVGEGRVEAEVKDVPTEVAPAADAATTEGVEMYALDKAASKVGALGAKVTAQHPITFHDFDAKIGVKDGKVASIEYTVQMGTLTSDNEDLTKHLKNGDFFDVPNHPTSTFKSVEIKEGSETEGATHTVSGDLTIRGNTKRVTFPATLAVTDGKVDAKAEFVVDRNDFKIVYKGKADNLIKDNVALNIAFVANKPAA